MFRKPIFTCTMFALAASMIAGCGGTKSETVNVPGQNVPEADAAVTTAEPATLKIMYFATLITQEAVDQFIGEPVKKKYPHITIEYVNTGGGVSFQKMIEQGTPPDLVITDYPNLSAVTDYAYPLDLNPYLEKYKVNLNQLDASPIQGIRNVGTKGEIFGLPWYVDKFMLFYNKDLFDKFAVAYPTDQMTYEDLVNVSRRLTRKEDQVQYEGVRWGNLHTVGMQWGIPIINKQTGKADFQNDLWKRALGVVKDIHEMGITNLPNEAFYKEKRMAMLTQWLNPMLGFAESVEKSGQTLNWDMASIPQHREAPGISGAAKPIYLLVSQSSKYKEQAFQAVSYISTSEEVQSLLSQYGKITALNSEAIRKQFGTKYELVKGKNIEAIFKHQTAPLPYSTNYEKLASPELNIAGTNVASGSKDVNTALREAEERANKKIEAQLK